MNAIFPRLTRKQIVVSGEALNCGHFLPGAQPEDVARELESFLR